MLIPENYNESWDEFLTDEIRKELDNIELKIGNDYTPSKEKVLRFLNLDLNKMKIVILGQDPYKPERVANGRSFQPNDLEQWTQSFKQVSLKNIIRLIHKSYNRISNYSEILSYKNLLPDIKSEKFPIKPPKEWFDSLENQGVLFLNTYLTCKINVSNSHKAIWEGFSKKLLKYISSKNPDLIWFLWGNESISNKEYIVKGKIYESRHPMMCAEKYEDDFLKCNCFKETMDIINWLG